MDRGAWQAAVHGVTKSRTQMKRLSTHTHKHESRDGGDGPTSQGTPKIASKTARSRGESPGTNLTACDEINPADTSILGFQPPELGGVSV